MNLIYFVCVHSGKTLTNAVAKYVVPEADTYDLSYRLRVADEPCRYGGIAVVSGRYKHEITYRNTLIITHTHNSWS